MHLPFSDIEVIKNINFASDESVTDGWTDRRTEPLIEMQGCISKWAYHASFSLSSDAVTVTGMPLVSIDFRITKDL